MPRYLISFPSSAMDVPAEDLAEVGDAASAVVEEMRRAGVYLTAGGIDESVPPVRVAGDGEVSEHTYPQTAELSGGMCIIAVDSRDQALEWAAKLAAACRCAQEVRQFSDDPRA